MVPRLLELAVDPVPVGDLLSFATPDDLARGVLLHLCWRQAITSVGSRQLPPLTFTCASCICRSSRLRQPVQRYRSFETKAAGRAERAAHRGMSSAARSPTYPGPSWRRLLQLNAVAQNLCSRALLPSVTTSTAGCGARPWAVPGAHSPSAGAFPAAGPSPSSTGEG